MKQRRSEVGRMNGAEYKLVQDYGEVEMPHVETMRRKWRFWLTIDGEYIGDFTTRREAITFLTKREVNPLT